MPVILLTHKKDPMELFRGMVVRGRQFLHQPSDATAGSSE